MDSEGDFIIFFVVFVTVITILSFGLYCEERKMKAIKAEAVEHGYAEWVVDQVNGETKWRWVDTDD